MSEAPMQPVIEVVPRVYTPAPRYHDALEDLQAELYNEVCANGRPVKQLLTALLDRRNLYAAWRFVRSNDGADTPGVDGVTCKEIERSNNNNEAVTSFLNELAKDVLDNRYRFSPPRWLEVPKPSGGYRLIGVLTVRDRVLHAALKQVLEPILEPIFLPSSFGFRPGRSVAGALHAAVTWMKLGNDGQLIFPYAMHLDIAQCFDTVDHEYLLRTLSEHIADEAVLKLIRQLLRTTGRTIRHWFRSRYVGLLQGSPLSPLLCNLALHRLDLEMKAMRSATQGGIAYYRYADDLLILARSQELARKAFYCAQSVLRELKQEFGVKKPPIVSLLDGVDWLGVRLRAKVNKWTGYLESGYVVPDETVRDMLARLTEMTNPPSAKLSEQTFDLGQWILSLNQQLRGWYQTFQYADNIYEVARTLDDYVSRRFEDVLMAVTGKSRYYLRANYLVRLPRGFRTWQVDGRELVLLSAEPPRRPRCISVRPTWMRPIQSPTAEEFQPFHPAPGTLPSDPRALPQLRTGATSLPTSGAPPDQSTNPTGT